MKRKFNGVYSYSPRSKPIKIYTERKYWKCEDCGKKYSSKGVEFMTDSVFPMPIKINDNKCVCGSKLLKQNENKKAVEGVGDWDEEVEEMFAFIADNAVKRFVEVKRDKTNYDWVDLREDRVRFKQFIKERTDDADRWGYIKGRNETINALKKVLETKTDPDLIYQIEEDLINELENRNN